MVCEHLVQIPGNIYPFNCWRRGNKIYFGINNPDKKQEKCPLGKESCLK
jgi:hypothetical protein